MLIASHTFELVESGRVVCFITIPPDPDAHCYVCGHTIASIPDGSCRESLTTVLLCQHEAHFTGDVIQHCAACCQVAGCGVAAVEDGFCDSVLSSREDSGWEGLSA